MALTREILNSLRKTAVEVATMAGTHALKQINKAQARVKHGDEIVTDIDTACQQMIIDAVRAQWPGHGFIAEEGGRERVFMEKPDPDKDIWWVIDPIDGTNNYAHGLLLFSVSVGVCHAGRVVAGAIYEPATDSMYAAAEDGTATLNNHPIQTGSQSLNEFTSIALDSHFEHALPGWIEHIMRHSKYRNFGSTALHMAYVAKAGLAAAVVNGGAKLWDIAAGTIIAQQAGAKVTQWDGSPIWPIDLANYDGRRYKLLTANPTIQQPLIDLIATEKS